MCRIAGHFKKFGKYDKLKRWLFASGREDDHARRQVNDGFQLGRAASTMFYQFQIHVRVVLHGDDFTFAATGSEVRKTRSSMCDWYDVKVRGSDVREIEILGRSLRWTEERLEYKACDKHRQAVLEGLGSRARNRRRSTAQQSNQRRSDNSAAVKPEEIGQEQDEETEKTRLRILATPNHTSLDRSDVQFAAKKIHTKIANPTRRSWRRLTKACRHLREVERVTWVWSKRLERRSTSGGMMMVNGTVVKHWWRTQASHALSTAEAEYKCGRNGSG